jgi:hypothetical protein
MVLFAVIPSVHSFYSFEQKNMQKDLIPVGKMDIMEGRDHEENEGMAS